jgi:hypothetical protein
MIWIFQAQLVFVKLFNLHLSRSFNRTSNGWNLPACSPRSGRQQLDPRVQREHKRPGEADRGRRE